MAVVVPNHLTALFLLISIAFSPPSSSSASPSPQVAAGILRSRGYSLSAGVLESASRTGDFHGWNATGTFFAPADSVFKNRRSLLRSSGGHHDFPRPSATLFLYHASQSKHLRWSKLLSLPVGSPIPTTSSGRTCLFLQRTPAGEPCLAASPSSKKTATSQSHQPCVKIRHPDLHLDGDLAVHGLDGVLDPSAASACHSYDAWRRRREAHLHRTVLALRRMGYVVVAGEIERRRAELAELTAVTVFAPRDEHLRYRPDGHRYDLRRHVVPRRYLLRDLARLAHGTRIGTMLSSAKVTVGSAGGAVVVEGVAVDGEAIYQNGWAVVLPIVEMLPISDDAADQVPDGRDYMDSPSLTGEFPAPAASTDQDSGDDGGASSPLMTEGQDYTDSTVESTPSPPPSSADQEPTRRRGRCYSAVNIDGAFSVEDYCDVDPPDRTVDDRQGSRGSTAP